MRPSGSTLRDRPSGGPALQQLAAQVLHARPPGELAALLVPMVRRGLRTATGPGPLVRWLGRTGARPESARRAAEDLVRTLFEPLTRLGDTVADARANEGAAPAVG